MPYLYIVKRDININNRSLWEECKRGDKEALNLFYTRFAPRMLAVIHRYVGTAREAEDILHDGFIIAFTRLSSLRNPDHMEYWLATIMKNLSLQFLHSQDVATLIDELPDIEDSPDMDEIIDMATLENLILKLPPGYQKVFRLAVLENKSHKEISKLLGIAPNSSSSQLFQAKLMMRRIITDYRRQAGILSLLLIAGGAGFYFIRHNLHSDFHNDTADYEEITSAGEIIFGIENSIPEITSNIASSIPSHSSTATHPQLSSPTKPVTNSSIALPEDTEDNNIVEDNDIVEDNEEPSATPSPSTPQYAYEPSYPDYDEPVKRLKSEHSWGISIGTNAVSSNFDISTGMNDMSNEISKPGDGNSPIPGEDDDRNDNDTGNYPPDNINAGSPFKAAKQKKYNDVNRHNDMPVVVSAAVAKRFSRWLSVETGLTYSYLHSTFETGATASDCQWHYLGIPLRLNINTFSFSKVSLYGSAGIQFDIPLYAKAKATSTSGTPELESGRFSASPVWSLSVSYGAAVKLSDNVEIFLTPTLSYHFEHNHVVPNVWTDTPLGFSLPLGLKFTW